ncbi:MAG: branched-chain amino acid transaminase [Armatimonadota bacterium]|nr:branched-chain amino acid transaminase [Armatimonadota bacterium]MDR5696833.1 branched-chain amino acid transaminase [Armatimonadota bacterium]
MWHNGRLVQWERATVHVMAHGLHYGSSVFEGIRAYETPDGAAVFCLEPHVRRLFDSCRIFRMEIPYAPHQIRDAILDTVAANGHASCYIRPLVYRGAGSFSLDPRKSPVEVAILTIEWGRYLGTEALERGVDVMVSSWRRMAPSTFPAMGKIGGNYVNSQLIAMEAVDNGYVEGIALDAAGNVSEGSGENVFVVRDRTILTPSPAHSILPGVTRNVAITLAHELGYEVREQAIPREMLYLADEIFFTGTAAEITPVRSVDRVPVGGGGRGPITEQIQRAFFDIVTGRVPDRHGWLTRIGGRRPAVDGEANVQLPTDGA